MTSARIISDGMDKFCSPKMNSLRTPICRRHGGLVHPKQLCPSHQTWRLHILFQKRLIPIYCWPCIIHRMHVLLAKHPTTTKDYAKLTLHLSLSLHLATAHRVWAHANWNQFDHLLLHTPLSITISSLSKVQHATFHQMEAVNITLNIVVSWTKLRNHQQLW